MQRFNQVDDDIFYLFCFNIVESDNVRLATTVAVFHDYDVANDWLAVLVCAVKYEPT